MMVINCSQAAATHLYGKYRRGRDDVFFAPPPSVPETLDERQQRLEQQGGSQWVVHAIKTGRSTSLIAMEYDTRWAHVIHQVRKGDVRGFIERLYTRLINGIDWLGTDFSLFTAQEWEAAVGYYQAQHRELRFYQQTDRSAMTHINQISALYQDVYYRAGAFPDDEETALEFDLQLNRDWRCRKGETMDRKVDEKMLMHWLTRYAGKTGSEAERIQAEMREARRTVRMAGLELLQRLTGDDGSNVVAISDFRK